MIPNYDYEIEKRYHPENFEEVEPEEQSASETDYEESEES